jgi:plastocyanin
MNATKNLSRWISWVTGAMICAPGLSGFAASVTIDVGNTNFIGVAVTNINVNDSIIWVWEGSLHSTTSTNSSGTLWDSGINNAPHSFTNTFTSPGSFPFFCTVHVSFGMTGVVNVAGSALPPTVSITNPPNGSTLSAPASFTLAAMASVSGGSVTNVQFFQGASSLGNVTTAPYAVPVNSLAAADYNFSAVASSDAGLTATNAITVHVVTPVAIVLSAPQFISPAEFRFNYTANPGLSYIVQRASSLNSGIWTTLGTNVAGGSPVLFDDVTATGNPAYYRVGRLPNP